LYQSRTKQKHKQLELSSPKLHHKNWGSVTTYEALTCRPDTTPTFTCVIVCLTPTCVGHQTHLRSKVSVGTTSYIPMILLNDKTSWYLKSGTNDCSWFLTNSNSTREPERNLVENSFSTLRFVLIIRNGETMAYLGWKHGPYICWKALQ
jgi:hypothetical protein